MIWRPAPAERLRNGSAGHAGQLIAHEVLPQVLQAGFAQTFALERDQTDGQAGSVELQDDGGQGAGRQVANVGHGEIGDGGRRGIAVRARLEIHLDDTHTGERAGFDVFDPAGQCEEAFEVRRDIAFDLLGRHAGEEGGHDDDGDVHGREHIDGHTGHADDAEKRDDQADDDDEVGSANGEARHQMAFGFGCASTSAASRGCTFCPASRPAWRPTMMRSPAARPERISTRCAVWIPVVTGTMRIVPSLSTT